MHTPAYVVTGITALPARGMTLLHKHPGCVWAGPVCQDSDTIRVPRQSGLRSTGHRDRLGIAIFMQSEYRGAGAALHGLDAGSGTGA